MKLCLGYGTCAKCAGILEGKNTEERAALVASSFGDYFVSRAEALLPFFEDEDQRLIRELEEAFA